MADKQYDVVIVGAGPAGLSAARTLARLGFKALVIERAAEPGEGGGVNDAIVVAGSGPVASEPAPNGFYFPQIDLLIPESLVLAQQVTQSFVAPGGEVFGTPSSRPDGQAILVDRAGLMRMIARQAEAAGAEFAWNTEAIGLSYDGDRVAGVCTSGGEVRAGLVLSAEGAARHLCGQVELYPLTAQGNRQALVMTQELEAPAGGPAQLGRTVTLGHTHSSAHAGFGSLLVPAPGRAVMSYTLFLDRLDCATVTNGWLYLAEYARDPRIAGLLVGASVVRRSTFALPLDRAPENIVRDGFMGLGDAVTPGGYLGILPAMYMGRQAALVAAGALEDADTSATALEPFDTFYRTTILPGLEAELRTMNVLISLDDSELDRLCATLNALHMPLPFLLNGPPQVAGETLGWLGRQLALPEEDLELVDRMYAGMDALPLPDSMPLFSSSHLAVA